MSNSGYEGARWQEISQPGRAARYIDFKEIFTAGCPRETFQTAVRETGARPVSDFPPEARFKSTQTIGKSTSHGL